MPLTNPVTGVFGSEWARFQQGFRELDPDYLTATRTLSGTLGPRPGQPGYISIPGWDDVIKLGPAYEPTPAERQEYRTALRQGRPPNLPPAVVAELDRR